MKILVMRVVTSTKILELSKMWSKNISVGLGRCFVFKLARDEFYEIRNSVHKEDEKYRAENANVGWMSYRVVSKLRAARLEAFARTHTIPFSSLLKSTQF